MSIKKLLGTGACMVIIGVSAGASYGLFQRLNAQAATPVLAQIDPAALEAPSTDIAPAQFVAAGITTWTPPEKSDVSTPVFDKPASVIQSEPPLLRYASMQTDGATSTVPSLPLFAHIDEAIVLGATPTLDNGSTVVAAPKEVARQTQSVATEVIVASAPRELTSPGTLRRFRGTGATGNNKGFSGQDNGFEQNFPPKTALKPVKARRPTTAATKRATQRTARFRQTWATGVYR